jgi:catechol 2,3-dioxygenase
MEDSERGVPAAAGASGSGYGIAPAGHRLPDDTRLGPVRLQVADLQRSLEYYRTVLGLRLMESEHGTATLAAHGPDRPLVVLRERAGAAPTPLRGRLGLYHFAILLPSRADLGTFLRHLSEIAERVGAADHHVSEALYLQDPDGLGIEVYADRPRSSWETNGRELRLETVPLDGEAVLRAAGNQPWRGMPAGTAMGHVHLHVGEIEEAASYYHDTLGFDKITWSYPGALFLSAGGYHHHLGLNTWAAGAKPAGDADARLLEWTLELPDDAGVAAAAQSLADAGYGADGSADAGFVTRDPWGTQLRLVVAPAGASDPTRPDAAA